MSQLKSSPCFLKHKAGFHLWGSPCLAAGVLVWTSSISSKIETWNSQRSSWSLLAVSSQCVRTSCGWWFWSWCSPRSCLAPKSGRSRTGAHPVLVWSPPQTSPLLSNCYEQQNFRYYPFSCPSPYIRSWRPSLCTYQFWSPVWILTQLCKKSLALEGSVDIFYFNVLFKTIKGFRSGC